MGQPPGTESRVQNGGEAQESYPQREVLENEAVLSRGHRSFLHSLKWPRCFFLDQGRWQTVCLSFNWIVGESFHNVFLEKMAAGGQYV